MSHKLMRKDATHVAKRKRPVGVLQHAAVGAAQDVVEVLALVGAHAGHVGVESGLPAAVAGPAAKLDDPLAAVGRSIGLLQAALEPRLAADVAQVAAHPLDL